MGRKIKSDDDVFSKAEFIELVKDGSFIDYDGHGYWSDGEELSEEVVKPSEVLEGKVPTNYTHVVWFNR